MRFENGRRVPRLPRRFTRMESGRRERAEGMVQDVIDGSPGGASDIQIRDRLVRRGYDEREVLDLLDDLRFEGRLALDGGVWRRPAPGAVGSQGPGEP